MDRAVPGLATSLEIILLFLYPTRGKQKKEILTQPNSEQRRQKLKEQLLKRKSFFASKQENRILSSSRDQKVMTSEDQIREETKALKLKTKMANKENVSRPTGSKNNLTMGKNCIPLKPSNELTHSTLATDTHNFEDHNQTLQLLPIKDDTQNQHMTLSQAFHFKNNSKKKQMTTERPKQDANMPKKHVLGSYRGQIVQSKINSFRKPLQVKGESSATTKELATTVSKATKPQPVNTSSVPVDTGRASSVMMTTKFVSTTSRNRQLLRPPIRSHHDNTQNTVRQGISRSSANVTFRKGPHEKELLKVNSVLSSVKTSSSQDVKRSKTLSRSMTSEIVVRPASNTKMIEKSKTTDQRRHTIAKAAIDSRLAQPKETAEERKARLNEWKASKGKVLKRPPNSVVTQPEPKDQSERPVGSFWTTMAEEDEQRLFTEKVNKTFSECLNLINEGCPKEEILVTLNDLIKNIPDAKKLVKYWICLARIEPLTSPIENIIAIYEEAILAGAQPIEEMRHAIADILTMKSQENFKFGEHIEEACATKDQTQEVNVEDIDVSLESGRLEMENKHHRSVVFQDCEKEQGDKTKDATNDVKTPSTETRAGCLIKYNVSTTPYLQSVKKKIQFDETNSTFKELKFLTPVRRSRRLQEKTSKLPDMLKDHYPCVSSLEQLTELGSETDAFVCRPNAALCRMYSESEITEEK
ncbi:cytoskeleton-associated protein 2 isoform X3 [Equus przewalskii]|uniref:Cytoskeleton-associated protein 2 isoform X3 n=1 Tax=Equus przewalskii TaxID=9798 RepID=A0ABM4L1A3_EQUPR